MNIVILIGRLTSSPELRHTGTSGKAVCNFSVAAEREFKDSDGNAVVDYHDCVAWGKQAEFLAKWFDKGVRVALRGELQTRFWEKDGRKNKVVEILVKNVEFADGKREANNINAGANTPAPSTDDDAFALLDDDMDLPFD